MNVRHSTATKTLVTSIANALGVPAKQLRALASTLKMLLNFQELSSFAIKNKKRWISIRWYSVVCKRLNLNQTISILIYKMNIRKLKTNSKKVIRFTIKKTTRNVLTREDAMLNGLHQQFCPWLSSLTYSTLFPSAVLSNNLSK